MLFSIVLASGLLVAEAGFRLAGADPSDAFRLRPMTPSVVADAARYRRHPERYFALAPHFASSATHLGPDAVGAWPFRGPVPDPCPPGVRRVAVVGDSCVYGASLDNSETLSHRIALALDRRGWDFTRLQVLNLGVPGYSSVQLDLLLEEALAELQPDAVVLYPAAWNDQAPALDRTDVELIEDPSWSDWVVLHSALLSRLRPPPAALEDKLARSTRRRVAPAELEARLRAMITRCRAAGVPCVLLSAPHPAATRQAHPDTASDAALVLAVAADTGASVVDGQAQLETLAETRRFVDYVHPSPEGVERLAAPLADHLADVLGAPPAPAPPSGLSVVSITPGRAVTFGDVQVEVRLEGWNRDAPLPSVSIGGAPLLDLEASGADRVRGMLMANGPGAHAVVVRTAEATAVAPQGLTLVEPSLEFVPGDTPTLLFRSRPGDACRVLIATERFEHPRYTRRGAVWIPMQHREIPETLVADVAGRAEFAFTQEQLQAVDTLYLQALVAPPGGRASAERWTPVCRLE